MLASLQCQQIHNKGALLVYYLYITCGVHWYTEYTKHSAVVLSTVKYYVSEYWVSACWGQIRGRKDTVLSRYLECMFLFKHAKAVQQGNLSIRQCTS